MRGLFTGWLNQVKQQETPAPEPVLDPEPVYDVEPIYDAALVYAPEPTCDPELDSDYLDSLLNDNDM
jgi:hypothetical protein